MTQATTISSSLNASNIKTQYDSACKKILSEKIILAWIMKYTMDEFSFISITDIAENHIIGTPTISQTPVLPDETNASRIHTTGIEDTSINEGTVTFDIHFFALLPLTNEEISLIINVEAQNDFHPGYPLIKRAIYYCSRMISSQYGTVFTHSHYEKIRKVYSVWICIKPPKDRQNTITSYKIKEQNLIGSVQETFNHYDLITAVMICLGDPQNTFQNSLLQLLDVLLSYQIDAIAKKQILENDFGIPMTQNFEGTVNDMCNLSDGVFQDGFKRGEARGAEMTYSTSIKSLMQTLHLTIDQAMDALQITTSDRDKYKSMILEQ